MAKYNIDLTVGGGTWYDGHGADISANTNVEAEIEMSVIYNTNTVVAKLKFYVSPSAQSVGGTATRLLYLSGPDILKAKSTYSVTVANSAAFLGATLQLAIDYIATEMETTFGAGSVTVI